MKLFRKLTKREWKEIGEKYKDGGVHMYRGKRTYFYNGEEKLYEADDKPGHPRVYDWKDCEVIIVLPRVEVIPDFTFFQCFNVKTVIMADTVRRIEPHAFNGCKSLVYVKLSIKLEYIGECSFRGCKSLTSIFIPESCKEIGREVFEGCEKLIVLYVPQTIKLGDRVIEETALIFNSKFGDSEGFYDEDDDNVNEWIKSRHDRFPLHKLCCSEDPKFNQNTIIPTKQECLRQDDLGWTPFMYLMCNNTADYDTIEQMVKIGGKELLFIQDKKRKNSLYYAYDLGDESMIGLLVRKGGRQLVYLTLKSVRIDTSSSIIKSALLLHNYIYAIENKKRNVNVDEMIDTLLESKPSFRETNEIMGIERIPDKHRQKLQEYNLNLLDQEFKLLQDTQEKVPLMRSTITVVGRGRDGKTSTINSLKGLPFEAYCESTKGTQTSEVDVHEIGIHVTNVEASDVAFNETDRDPFSTIRSMESHLMKPDGERRSYDIVVENASSESTTPNQSSSVDAITKRLARQTLDSNVSIKKESRLEEDIAKKADDIDLATGKDGKAIRFTIYDNGGQKVFRSIQNLLLSREGIFIVVFDMMKIFNKNSRKEALEHLSYWLYSIKVDACEANSNEYTDPSIKYPPVILVGTHYDEFVKLKEDRMEGLKVLNKILVDNLHLSDLVPLPCQSNDSVPRDRQQLYNEAQGLCFWPVDNSNPNDANIQAIRRILLDAAINDPGFDIAQEVPISFLQAMDNLTEISEKVPILPIINCNDPQEYSVMNIMNKCGVFEDGIDEEQQNLQICKTILKQYQSIGHFIYFDQIGLQNYCILDPQWLINMITYIIRDFKLHRFRRDFNAMALNNGESWKSLLNKGILDGALLRKLWLDCEHEQFLTKLMLELGIFGNLFGDVEALSSAKFTVPIAVTISSNESRELSLPALREHLGVKSLDDTMKECINMSSCPFNLVPFYSRLVNRLISEWRSGYKEGKNPPALLPCAANLYIGKDYKFSILINEEDSTLDIFVSDRKKMNIILKYISEACSFVNAKLRDTIHATTTSIEAVFCDAIPAVNLTNEVIFRNATDATEIEKEEEKQKPFLKTVEESSPIPATTITTEADIQEIEECNPNLQALIDVFQNEKFARKIHEKFEDVTPEELIQMYYSDSDAFVQDILPELGIMQKLEQFRFINILKSKSKPTDEIYAIFNFLDDNDLAGVRDEEEAICKNMRMSSYFSFAYKVLRDDKKFHKLHKELVAHQECKVVHCSMHGSSIDTFVTTTLASRLQKSSVKCMVLNMCKSEHTANDLRDKAKIEKLVYWLSDLEDNAARIFSEAFYFYLCLDKKANYLEFNAAFDFAIESLRLRDYLLIDPANKEELEQEKRDRGRPDLVAAGIPKFYDRSQEQQEDLSLAVTIVSPSYASRNANSSTSTTATQPDVDHYMDVDSTNASKKEENPRSSILQEEPPPSSTSTAMASRQPNNQNVSSQSDVNSSKKRRRVGDQESPPNSKADIPRNSTCEILCEYEFQCNKRIHTNCMFIKYTQTMNPSIDEIVDVCWRQSNKSVASLKQCEKCSRIFCNRKRVPSKENSEVFLSCFDAHKCNTPENKKEPDITICVPKECSKYELKKRELKHTKPTKSKNGQFEHCKPCCVIDTTKSSSLHESYQNISENPSSSPLDSFPFDPNIGVGDDNLICKPGDL